MMKLKSLILLCLALGIFMPSHVHANATDVSEPFNDNLPSEIYLKNAEKAENDKPSLRWSAPYEDGDGFDQKVPLGELTIVNVLGLIGLCVVYSIRKKNIKNSDV